ncbi:Putative calcium ion binding protein [Madurella fahalii]|uniref:Calcium ion binding protein n=1 Tax=Madurella fahalii TaxID=1157608 RepID=A0ABQ0FXI5_9PEZI
MDTNAAASTLTRQRISVAVLSLAATATLGYFCYRIYNPPLPEPSPDRALRRSNAVRHRRRSIPSVVRDHERQPSEASSTSVESHADENVDVNTVRPLTDGETVADEHVLEDNWYDDESNQYSHQQARAGQNIVSLLFRVAEDNARRNAYVHRGCKCNGCGLVPIRGIRYRCANCADFDLCETCESQGLHTKTHIFYKIKIPAPRLGTRQLQPVWYPGDPENCLRLLPKHLMAKLSKETGFERPELEALWEQWTFMASTEWREDPDELGLAMDRKTFERYLVPSGGYRHIAPNLLHDRMFAFYDDNNDDLIGFSEFLRGTSYRKRRDRLRRIFDGYDVDGDGYVNRRDFLRLFRAYYVLFKQMHKDILDGLDDQVMSSVEVEQLVTSRQPLSSLFGREGGFSDGDTDRPMEGKVINESTGEVHISHGGNRAVNEDAPDTADRQSILASVFAEQARAGDISESLFVPIIENPMPPERGSGIEYLNGLLNPPTRINDLQALLVGETRDGEDFLVVMNGRGNQHGSGDEHEVPSGDENLPRPGENDGPSGEDRTGSSDGGEAGPRERELRRVPYKANSGRRARLNARRKLFERWKRRQFYLDEEEGALPPEDWSDDDDILATLNGTAEDSNATQPVPLSRSRSSSKVRFAEDTDDFDIRSNPSTSSRSVPERWGGMEIPDAERDVGKEIFYQVIQQAFNEILDRIFKAKEDLAVKAAKTKELRDKYRSAFESMDLDENTEHNGGAESATRHPKCSQEQSLQELLNASGYSVDDDAHDKTGGEDGEHSETSAEDEDEMPPLIEDDGVTTEECRVAESTPYRDPTMPQFRPNSEPTPTRSEARPSSPAKPATEEKRRSFSSKRISRRTLMYWKRLDLAEEEAKQRGGWGRLSYPEFERIYKAEEARGKRMDFLGTWIDFCLPIS